MQQPITEILENPEIFRINRLDAHSDHTFFNSLETMHANEKTLFQSLNGIWKFHWSKNLDSRPKNFFELDFDFSSFDEIPVPSHIEMNGYDQIHYVNTMYPWDGKCNLRPPFINQEYNPVGSYICTFDMDNPLPNHRTNICFHGVEQAFSLWLNGAYIGYAADTFTPSHFDLTEHIKEKDNRLCVEVYKRTSSAWIEDQDFFRFSGIFRDVVIYQKPQIHIEDLWAIPTVSEDFKNGELTIKVKVSGTENPNIHVSLYAPNQQLILKEKLNFNFIENDVVEVAENNDAYFVSQTFSLTNISLWDIKQPNLYEVVLTVSDDANNFVEVVLQKIGFRSFGIKDKVMYLNGKRLIINGVNRHEWNPRKGRSIDASDMLADMEVIKRNNINSVRTSHYPNQSLWYDLCDEEGILLMDESNLESHGSWQKMGVCEPSWNVPANLKEWRNVVVDRAVSMFERDKNHPSILWWSCGNEAYAGECILAMGDYFRRKDASRVVHYEGSFWNRDYDTISDIESRMYAYPKDIRHYLENECTKPFILCEYMHNMGNSLGGMESYIKLVDEFESCQGGFIWDYMDQAIYLMKDGKEVLGYGGDFGDRPTDYNFSGNGIVFADRTEKPAMQEVRFWYLPKEERDALIQKNELALAKTAPKEKLISNQPFEIINGDLNLGIKGENFHIMFSYPDGGPVSIVHEGYEWIYRPIKPTYWRAITENDNANGFGQKSGLWNYADLYSKHIDVKVNTDIEGEVTITYIFDTFIGTNTTVSYTVYGDGTIKVKATLEGKDSLPDLPLFGTRFITQDKITKYEYQGYSGETYPDRYKGGTFGIHQATVSMPAYLVPQECGCHVYNHFVKLFNEDGKSLKFTAIDDTFHFSLLHNTAQELQNALHQFELPNTERSVLNILTKMRGVGGIDTWGADVEEAYHISAKEDISFSYYISFN